MWLMISYDSNEDIYYGPFISEQTAVAYAEAHEIMFFVLEPLRDSETCQNYIVQSKIVLESRQGEAPK